MSVNSKKSSLMFGKELNELHLGVSTLAPVRLNQFANRKARHNHAPGYGQTNEPYRNIDRIPKKYRKYRKNFNYQLKALKSNQEKIEFMTSLGLI